MAYVLLKGVFWIFPVFLLSIVALIQVLLCFLREIFLALPSPGPDTLLTRPRLFFFSPVSTAQHIRLPPTITWRSELEGPFLLFLLFWFLGPFSRSFLSFSFHCSYCFSITFAGLREDSPCNHPYFVRESSGPSLSSAWFSPP